MKSFFLNIEFNILGLEK